MATFARLTRAETGKAFWLNLDHVTEICPGESGCALRAAAGGVWIVRETPETISFLAYAENPQPVR